MKTYNLTDNEIASICEEYEKGYSMNFIAHEFNITVLIVKKILVENKIPIRKTNTRTEKNKQTRVKTTPKDNHQPRVWDEVEDKALLTFVKDNLPVDRIARIFNTTEEECRTRIKEITTPVRKGNRTKSGNMTCDEMDFMIENASSMTCKEICEKLNRPRETVRGWGKRLNLQIKEERRCFSFTKEEDELIIHYYPFVCSTEIGKKINKTSKSVQSRIRILKKEGKIKRNIGK